MVPEGLRIFFLSCQRYQQPTPEKHNSGMNKDSWMCSTEYADWSSQSCCAAISLRPIGLLFQCVSSHLFSHVFCCISDAYFLINWSLTQSNATIHFTLISYANAAKTNYAAHINTCEVTNMHTNKHLPSLLSNVMSFGFLEYASDLVEGKILSFSGILSPCLPQQSGWVITYAVYFNNKEALSEKM